MAFGVMDAAKQLGIGWDTFHIHVAPNVKWVRFGAKKVVSRAERGFESRRSRKSPANRPMLLPFRRRDCWQLQAFHAATRSKQTGSPGTDSSRLGLTDRLRKDAADYTKWPEVTAQRECRLSLSSAVSAGSR
jgi:hypothetical protein